MKTPGLEIAQDFSLNREQSHHSVSASYIEADT